MAGVPSVDDLFPANATPGPWSDPHATLARILGPGQISSATRSAARNNQVGGSPTSSHLSGQAVDWEPADRNTRAAAQKLAASGVPFDQIIDEGTHLHVGFGPKMRHQALTSVVDKPPPVDSLFQAPPPPVDTLFADKPAPPKLKPGTVPVPPSLMDRVASGAQAIGSNLMSDIADRSHAAQATIGEGLNDLSQPHDPNAGPMDENLRNLGAVAKVAGGAFGTVAAPISGAMQDIVGRPVETATGGKLPRTMMGDYTDSMLGFLAPESLLTPKAKAARARAATEPPIEGQARLISERQPPPVDELFAEPAAKATPPSVDELFPAPPEPAPEAATAPPEPAPEAATAPPEPAPEAATAPPEPALKQPTLAAATEAPEDVSLEAPEPGGPIVGAETDPVERVDNALYRVANHNQAGQIEGMQFLKDNADTVENQPLQEELTHAIEQKMIDPDYQIPEHLQEAEAIRAPWAARQLEAINTRRALGDETAVDYPENSGYVPRYPIEYDPTLDTSAEGPQRGDPILSGRGGLGTSTASTKARTAGWVVTDEDGNTHFSPEPPAETDIQDRPYASVRPATIQEIEQNAGTDLYNKNATVNTMRRALHDEAVVRHLQVLEDLKQQLVDQGLAHRDMHYFRGEDGLMNEVPANSPTPEGFRQVPGIPGFKGWSFAPHIAEVLEDNFGKDIPWSVGDIAERVGKVNRTITAAMFAVPAVHLFNVGAHWAVGRGFSWVRPSAWRNIINTTAEAAKEVSTLGPKYREMLKEGAGLQAGGTATKGFQQAIAKAAGKELFSDPETMSTLLKAANLPVAKQTIAAVKAWYNTSSKILWRGNDILLMQRILELQKTHGLSMRDAIQEAERDIPNYRVPSRVGGTEAGMAGRAASVLLRSQAIGLFGKFHYGVARGWAAMIKDVVKGTPEQRVEALGKVLSAIVLGTAGGWVANKGLQKVTGNKNAKFNSFGPFSMSQAVADAGWRGLQDNLSAEDRNNLPQWAKDNIASARTPAEASSAFFSLGPAINMAKGVLPGSKDYFGHDIATPDTPSWMQAGQIAKYEAEQTYPGQVAEKALAGNSAGALAQLVGAKLPTQQQVQMKAKYNAKDKKYAARAVGAFRNRVASGDVGKAIDKLGRR